MLFTRYVRWAAAGIPVVLIEPAPIRHCRQTADHLLENQRRLHERPKRWMLEREQYFSRR